MKSNKGFTLVELIVVIAILVLLSTLAVNAFSGIMEQARLAQDRQAAAVVANALNTFNAVAATANDRIEPPAMPGGRDTLLASAPSRTGGVTYAALANGYSRGFGASTSIQHTASSGLLPIGVNWNVDNEVWYRIASISTTREEPQIRFNHNTGLWYVGTR